MTRTCRLSPNLEGILLAVVAWSCSVTLLYAEVMDKEPTVAANWLWAVVGGGLAILAWRWRWWVGVIVSTLALVHPYVMYLEVNDPSVGPAIRREAGQGYVTQYYWSAAVAVALHMVAAYGGLKARRERRGRH